uniref:Mitochondrial import inner membrane translocase subunit n=1 Tax=Schistosoma mansoni TaxID=6183 RepID=A0A146MGK6_SCHMA
MSFDYESALSSRDSDGVDKELQTFIQTIQQRAEFQNHVNHLTSVCWDKCAAGYRPRKWMRKSKLYRKLYRTLLGRFHASS